MQSSNITFLNLKKHQGIIFKSGYKAIIFSDILADDKNYRYTVQPYLDSAKIADTLVYNLTQNVSTPFLRKINNLIQFQNKKILIFDKGLQNKRLLQKLKVDYLYITGNPDIDLNTINKNYDYALLVVDGSNTDKLVNSLEKQAQNLHIRYKILKRNNSLIMASN